MKEYIIYVDGSFNTKIGKGGYGLVVTCNREILYEESQEVFGDGLSMRNVYGEIAGACRAVELATMFNIPSIKIAFDYEGVEKWATGNWKRKNEHTKKYYEYMQYISKVIKVEFIKIKAHSGDEFNELADKLAKRGAGF